MKRTILAMTFVLMLLLTSLSVSAFSLQTTPDTITLSPGETSSSVNLLIENTGDETIQILGISRTAENDQILTGFNPTSATLSPGNSVSIAVTVSNPSIISSGTYNLGIVATANDTTQNQSNLEVIVPEPTNQGFQFGEGPINLGGPQQEREQTIISNIRIVNDQEVAVTNFALQFTGATRYEFATLTAVPTTIQPYETVNIQFRVFVPKSQDSDRRSIGNLAYTSNQGAGSVQLFMETASKLTIDRVNFVADSGTANNLDDGERIRRTIAPGESFSFEVTLRNEFSDRSDTIEDTFVNILIEDIDDGADIEEESDFEDIDGGRTYRHTIEFDAPTDSDTDEYRVIVEAEGVDRDGALHTQRVEYFLEVRRERDDVQIISLRATPETVCIGETVNIRTELRNEGTNDQNNAAVRVQVEELRFDEAQRFTVRKYDRTGNEYTGTFRISTSGAIEGTYTARVTSLYDGNQISDYEETTFRIIRCEPEEPPVQPPVEQPPVIIQPPVTPPTEPTEPSDPERSTMDTLYIILLVVGNIAIVLIIIFMIARLLRR